MCLASDYFRHMTFPYPVSHEVPLFLAPMAGVSEPPFRLICREFGADVVVTEFLSCEGLRRGIKSVHDGAFFVADERPIGIQIYGGDPASMAEAAELVTRHYEPDFIDINFGCPVKKVVKRNGGSGCLRDLDLVARIIRAVDEATSLPTTVKIRSGYDEQTRDPVEIGLRCQDAGARIITLHARTRADMYSGSARWDEIAALVAALDIPVIGNGDIHTGADALRMKDETGCAGIMIARAGHGRPWIFRQARAALEREPVPADPDVEERFRICIAHARNAISFGGEEKWAVMEFRKHLGWYTKGLPDGASLRSELFSVTSLDEIETLLTAYLELHLAGAAAA